MDLVSDDRLHERLARAARRTAETRFSTELIIPKYEAYYRTVTQATGTSRYATVSK